MVNGPDDHDGELEDLVCACLDAAEPLAELQRRTAGRPELFAAGRRLLQQVGRLEDLDGHALAGDGEPLAGPREDDPASWPRIPGVQLQAWLGRGGQGIVLRGRQSYLERPVAVKVLAPEAQTPAFVDRFRREARMLAELQHPHIVTCHDAGVTAAGECYLVMELVDGTDLRRWLQQHGKLPPAAAARLVLALVDALEHAQQRGLVHRDVKPENVLLHAAAPAADAALPFVPKLADLGLARVAAAVDGTATMLTPAGAVLGTPATMAPEQLDDPQSVDHRADIYGLGCILHHALTGRPAFTGVGMTALVMQKAALRDPQAQPLLPGVPPQLCRLLWRMLAWSPDDRPSSYGELRAALRECAASGAPRRTHPQRTAWMVAAAATAALATVWLWPDRREPHADSDPHASAPAAPRDDRPPLPAGANLDLFPSGTLTGWTAAEPQRWQADESGRGVLVNARNGRLEGSRELPGGEFVLRGCIEPRYRYVSPTEPRVPIESVGWRVELGDAHALALTVHALGGERFAAKIERQERTAGGWVLQAELGSCAGVFPTDEPLTFELRWAGDELTLHCGPGSAKAAAQATARPADWSPHAAPRRLVVHADRGVAVFTEWRLSATQ